MAQPKSRTLAKAESYVYHVKGEACARIRTVDDLKLAYTIEDRPLAWQLAGRTWTATGYGAKIPSSKVLRFAGERPRRIYVTIYSNSGTAWITRLGKRYVVRD